MAEDRDIIISIYPDPSEEGAKLGYSTQEVINKGYYPEFLQFLIDKINNADTAVEIERGIDSFTNFVSTRKEELISEFRLAIRRENINQRSIFILINSHNEALQSKNNQQLVYVAGPVGGGLQQLDHDLTESKPEKWTFLVMFDEKNVALPVDQILAENQEAGITEVLIYDSGDELTSIENLPISIFGDEYNLIKASSFFQRQYEELSTLNDFSPLIDSGVTAAQSIINASLIYFRDFPEVLKQRIMQYNIQDQSYVDFFGIQKLFMMSPDINKIEAIGYEFSSHNKNGSFTIEKLFKGLKIFLLSENSVLSLNNVIKDLQINNKLTFEIENYEKQYQSIGSRGQINRFEGRRSEVLRQLIGAQALQDKLDNAESILYYFPMGFVHLNKLNPVETTLITSFNAKEFPTQYISALENISNSLLLLSSGPLSEFGYPIDEISVILRLGDHTFKITKYRLKDADRNQILVSYVTDNLDKFHLMLKLREIEIPKWIDDFESWKTILPALDIQRIIKDNCELRTEYINPETFEKSLLGKSLTSYAEKILSPHVVSVLLKRILIEISNWEEGIDIAESSSQLIKEYELRNQKIETELIHQQSYIDKFVTEVELSTRIESRMQDADKEVEGQYALDNIGKKIDEFNSDFYNFLINSLRREKMELGSNSQLLASELKRIFEDLKEAIIDFGLTPSDWVYADNLQLWNTYTAQLKYVRHSLTLQLRDFLGNDYDGEDMDTIITYKHILNMVYNSFEGILEGHEYVRLKKAFLYLLPKLDKYKDDIKNINTATELMETLEILETRARDRVRSQLPKLPTFRR